MRIHNAPKAIYLSSARRSSRTKFRSLNFAAVCLLTALLSCGPGFAHAAVLPFYIGGDISSTTFIQQQVAAAGGQFTDSGVAAPLDQIMYDHGANLFRLRVFVNPDPNWNDTAGTIQSTAYDIALAQQIRTNDPGTKSFSISIIPIPGPIPGTKQFPALDGTKPYDDGKLAAVLYVQHAEFFLYRRPHARYCPTRQRNDQRHAVAHRSIKF